MTVRDFKDLTPAEAEVYRAQFAADGPARLAELARLLVADGVPLDEFDATVPSLGPLWRWYQSFVTRDFPGIAADAVGRRATVETPVASVPRLAYAAEILAHYMYEVAATCFRDVSWVTNPDVGMDSFQRVVAQYWRDDGTRGLAGPEEFAGNTIGTFLLGKSRVSGPDFLERGFLTGPFWSDEKTAERCLAIPRGASILAPLLDRGGIDHLPSQRMLAREPLYTREAVPSALVMRQQKAAARSRNDEPAGDELVLAHTSANVETLEESVPLDAAGISALLAGLGFLSPAGGPPTIDAILAEDSTEFYLDEDAMATTLVAGGQLRAVQLASITTTRKTWTALTTAFKKAGRPMGAKLAREDEFMPDEEY